MDNPYFKVYLKIKQDNRPVYTSPITFNGSGKYLLETDPGKFQTSTTCPVGYIDITDPNAIIPDTISLSVVNSIPKNNSIIDPDNVSMIAIIVSDTLNIGEGTIKIIKVNKPLDITRTVPEANSTVNLEDLNNITILVDDNISVGNGSVKLNKVL